MTATPPAPVGFRGRLRAEVEMNGSFYAAFSIGLAVWLATWGQHPPLRVLLAADVFFAVYIGLMLRAAGRFAAAARPGGASRAPAAASSACSPSSRCC